MKKVENRKKVISITLDPGVLKMLDEKTSNRSNYFNFVLLDYFNKLGEDTSKIKL